MSHIAVTSIAEHFRRAGISFTRTPTVLDAHELGETRATALINEPNLSIRPATAEEIAAIQPAEPAEPESKTKPAAKSKSAK